RRAVRRAAASVRAAPRLDRVQRGGHRRSRLGELPDRPAHGARLVELGDRRLPSGAMTQESTAANDPANMASRTVTDAGTVTSAHGTTMAFPATGERHPLVIGGGAFNDGATATPLAELLAGSFAVYTYDRRGRGSSGDTAPYAPEREIEDLHALIAQAGGAVH